VWWLAAIHKYNCHILILFISSLERSNVVGIYNVGLYLTLQVRQVRESSSVASHIISSSLALRDDIGNPNMSVG